MTVLINDGCYHNNPRNLYVYVLHAMRKCQVPGINLYQVRPNFFYELIFGNFFSDLGSRGQKK